jgi:cytidylate kinase
VPGAGNGSSRRRGIDAPLAEVRDEIERRDRRDRERALAPLVPAADAIVVDTSGMSVEAQVDAVLKAVEEKVGPS